MKKYLFIVILLLLNYLNLFSTIRYNFLYLSSNQVLYLRNLSLEIKDFYTFYLNIEKIRKENIDLKNRLIESEEILLKQNLKKYNDIELERTKLLFTNDEFFANKQISMGEITYYNSNNSTILISNNDTNFKMNSGDLVMYGRSVVGVIINVNNNSAEVKLISARDLNLNTFVVNKNLVKIKTVLSGEKFDALSINNILATELIEEGDLVLSATTNQGIPADLIIGKLDRIENISSQTFRKASVRKLYDLNVIKYVGILKNDK